MITYKGIARNTVRLEVSGMLHKEDYLTALPSLEGLHQKYGRINYVIELVDFRGWTPAAVWQELKFDATHSANFGRVAIVGEAKWEGVATKIGGFLFPAEVRFFDREAMPEARKWTEGANAVE